MKDDVRRDRPPQPRRIIPLALQGARTNLGGTVMAASTGILCRGVPVARVGDRVSHPALGDAYIITGLDTVRWKGTPLACAGSLTSRPGEFILDPGQAGMVGVEYDDGRVSVQLWGDLPDADGDAP